MKLIFFTIYPTVTEKVFGIRLLDGFEDANIATFSANNLNKIV